MADTPQSSQNGVIPPPTDPHAANVTRVQSYLRSGERSMQEIRQGLVGAGYSPAGAEGIISKAAAGLNPQGSRGGSSDTFLGETGLPQLAGIAKGLFSGATSGPASVVSGLGHLLSGVMTGEPQRMAAHSQAAGDALMKGDLGGFLDHTAGVLPGVGESLYHLATNVNGENYSAAAGDGLALFGPALAERALGAAGAGAKDFGNKLYYRNLPLDADRSAGELRDAVKFGMDQKLPTDDLFSVKQSANRIGSVRDPDSLMGKMETQANQYVTGTNGAAKIRMSTDLAPFISAVRERMGNPTAGGQKTVETMVSQIEPWVKGMSKGLKAAFEDPTLNLTPEQKVGLIEKWASGNNFAMDVAGAHSQKRAIYKGLSDQVYKEGNGNVVPGEKEAQMALAEGHRNAINEVHPGMAPINHDMHSAILLQDALKEAAKKSPKDFDNMARNLLVGSQIAIAGGAGAGAYLGHPMAGASAVPGILALQAMKSPQLATRIAIASGNTFPGVTDAIRSYLNLPGVQTLPAAARSLGNDPIQQLFAPPSR